MNIHDIALNLELLTKMKEEFREYSTEFRRMREKQHRNAKNSPFNAYAVKEMKQANGR